MPISNDQIYRELHTLTEDYHKRGLVITEIKSNLDQITPLVVKHEALLYGNNGSLPGLLSIARENQKAITTSCMSLQEMQNEIKGIKTEIITIKDSEKIQVDFKSFLKFLVAPVVTAVAITLAIHLLNL